jgi:serine/threonine protein phosphatase 1
VSLVKHFGRNTAGRDFAIGDIHGHFSSVERLLIGIGFDGAKDRLFSVGDLVDRGPECDRALEFLAHPWFHAVRGNHEDMAIRWPNGNMDAHHYTMNGGGWNVSNPPAAQRAFSDAFDALPIAMDVETEAGLIGVVHADCPFPAWRDFMIALEHPDLPRSQRKAVLECAMWSRARIGQEDRSIVEGVRAVIVGHTPLKHSAVLGNVHYIDTGGWLRDGYFTLIDLATLETIPPIPKKLEWTA